MKQETLAKGICSPAHLSRIENGLSVPSEEMIHMLSKRLGISLFGNKLAHENMNNTLEKVVNQSIHVINRRDKKQAIRLVEEAEEMLKMQEMNAERRIDIELLILRLLIMEKSNSEVVLREVNKYKEVEATLNTIQRFRVYVIIGITNYVRGGLIQSLKAFTIASKLSKVPIISHFEQADFLYTYAVVLMANAQKIKALERAKLAMEYFKSEMVNRRFVECLLLCGIAYKQMNQFEKALETFLQAERICILHEMKDFLGIVYQNLGHAYFGKGEFEQAIEKFESSLQYKQIPNKRIFTILSLVKTYSQLNKHEETTYWLEEGDRLLPLVDKQSSILFEKHFNVYRAFQSKNKADIERELIIAFNFFESQHKQKQMKEYAGMLAKYYSETRKYKKAVDFYKIIFE